jgi:hypothetical protein
MFEPRDGLMEVPLDEVQIADTAIRKDEAFWLTERLGKPKPFFSPGNRLGELAQLRKAPDEVGKGGHGRGAHAEALTDLIPLEGRHVPPKAFHGPPIVAEGAVGHAQRHIRIGLEGDISEGRGDSEGALAGLDGSVMVAHHPEIVNHMVVDPAQPPLIVKSLGEAFGGAEVVEHRPEFSKRNERKLQIESEIEGLREGVATLRKVLQGAERLLQVGHRLPVGSTRGCLGAGLPEVGHGFAPDLALQGVMGQQFDLLGQPVGVACLDGLRDLGMQAAPPLLQKAAVSDLMGEGVLEGIFQLGVETRLIEELSSLQV